MYACRFADGRPGSDLDLSLSRSNPFQMKIVLIKSNSEERIMKNEGEANEWRFSLLIVWAGTTINFKTFGLFQKPKRYFDKCRPRFHIPSLDR
jgi:hypothetical protein